MMEAGEEAALMAAIAQGDEAALGQLVRAHGERVRALALRFTGSGADADEVVNAVFLALWRAAERWETGRARIGTWLHRATVNRCIDLGRARRTRAPVSAQIAEGAAEALADGAPGAEARLGARQELAAVRGDILALPERQRAAILLAAAEARVPEIAEALGVSAGAAEQLLVRARRALRERRRARQDAGEGADHDA